MPKQKAGLICVPAHQPAVAVARVPERAACPTKNSAFPISTDNIAVLEIGFVTDDSVFTITDMLRFEHFKPC